MTLVNVYHTDVEMMVEDVPCKIGLYHRLASGSPAGFPALDLNTIFVSAIIPSLKAILSSSVQIMRVITRCLTPTDGIPYESNFTEANVGTGNAEAIAPSIAVLYKMRTVSPNSRNNGHIYVPGVPESFWVTGVWDDGAAGALFGALATVITNNIGPSVAGLNYTPCVVSRFLNNAKRIPAVTFDVSSATWVETAPSQQRRRQSGKQGIKA